MASSSRNTTESSVNVEIQQDDNDKGNVSGVFVAESNPCNFVQHSDGTNGWIPIVSDDIRLVKDTIYDSLELGIQAYKNYAYKAGFDVRRATEVKSKGLTQLKYMLCSKSGNGCKASVDTIKEVDVKKKRRKSSTKTTNCKACARFSVEKGTKKCKLYWLEEEHNHSLFDDEGRRRSRQRRQLNIADQIFIHSVASSNIGATKAHNLRCMLNGGHDQVGATAVDFKNFRRDMDIFVGPKDAQMVINQLNDKKVDVPGFSFDYKCDGKELSAMFWADAIAKVHYSKFGDVMSFDATFQTNK